MSEGARFVVVGAGLAGAATAWQLATRGHEVMLLERATPANDRGSSHGSARIFRYAYPEEFYSALVVEAAGDWAELERQSGERLITPTGSLDFGARRDPAGLAAVLDRVGVDNELLSADDARSRWPQIAFDGEVLWHPDAGVIDAETAVTAMVRLAESAGAVLKTDWTVDRVEPRPSGYRVVSDRGEAVDAEHVVITAGGWLPSLLDRLALPQAFRARMPQLSVRQEQAFHFPYADQGRDAVWPTFIHKAEGMQVYGLPGGRDAGFVGQKIAEYNGGRLISSAEHQTGMVDPANRARVASYVEHTVPGLDARPYAETTCLFTSTPDEDFIIDTVDGITIVSPCSGHGAKFAPLIGRIAADVASGTGVAPERFALPGSVRAESAAR